MSDFFEYMNFFFVLIGASLWCWGFHVVTKKLMKEAFGIDIDDSLQWYELGQWQTLLKPLLACPACMASVHGTVIFFVVLLGDFKLLLWPVFCIMLCGLNYIITKLFPEYE